MKTNYAINVAFAIEDLTIAQQKNLLALSDVKAQEATKNQINRLKRAKAFAQLSENALALIVSVSDANTLEQLVRSDDKSSCANYKTAQRIADLAKLLVDDSCVTAVKRAFNNFQKIAKNYERINLDSFLTQLDSTPERSKNYMRALYFFRFIDVNSAKRANERFIDRMSVNNDTVTILKDK